MRGSIGRYRKPNGDEEVRMHFPEWELHDGRVLRNVTIYPHLCATCSGGNHTHVETNDTRPVVEILAEEAVDLSGEHKTAIDRLLTEKIAVDSLTEALAVHVSAFA